jgi:polyphenol oxidase
VPTFELAERGGWSYLHYPGMTDAGVVHGFLLRASTRIVTDRVARQDFTEAFGAASSVIMNQVHGNTVHVVRDGERPEEGDGLIILERNIAAVVKTADCLPVLLHAPDVACAAAIHAGWRGTTQGIVEEALRSMVALGANTEYMTALLGPGIGPCCYEVREDVRQAFQEACFEGSVFQTREDRLFLDLKRANRLLLERAGVRQIYDTGLCTHCREDLFHSARRDGSGGRQINFVMLRG